MGAPGEGAGAGGFPDTGGVPHTMVTVLHASGHSLFAVVLAVADGCTTGFGVERIERVDLVVVVVLLTVLVISLSWENADGVVSWMNCSANASTTNWRQTKYFDIIICRDLSATICAYQLNHHVTRRLANKMPSVMKWIGPTNDSGYEASKSAQHFNKWKPLRY